MLVNAINQNLEELIDLLSQLSIGEYTKPCLSLSNATIGEHTRHIIELFQCLENHYNNGVINYDDRKRDYQIQTDKDFASQAIMRVSNLLNKPNKDLRLKHFIDGNEVITNSNYHRELLYNLEHCIHHQALIKVAVLEYNHLEINDTFGVARSTIEYRKQCAQ